MVKNTAGQKIGAQMVSATDGSAFTGAVTVYVTLDAGTQAIGSVGSGACTHEGNGYHTYAPAQAETNGTLLGFTFIGTGAVPGTVQVFTTGFDPTAAVVPANTTQFAGQTVTAAAGVTLPSSVASPTNITAGTITNVTTVNGLAAGVITAASIADGAIDAATFAADVDAEILSYLVDDATRIDASALNTATVTTIPAILDDTDLIDDGTSGLAKIATDVAAILVDTGTTLQAELDGIQADTEDIQTRLPAALVGGRIDANVGAISGDATAADTLESYTDGTAYMPVDAHAPNFSVSGVTLTVKQPDGTTTAYTKTVTTDAGAEPITGAS